METLKSRPMNLHLWAIARTLHYVESQWRQRRYVGRAARRRVKSCDRATTLVALPDQLTRRKFFLQFLQRLWKEMVVRA